MGSSGENVNWEPHNRMCRLVLLLGLFGLCSSVHILPSPSYIHTSPLVNSLAGNYVVAPVSYQSQFYYPQQINALNSFYQPPKPLVSPSLGYPIYNYGSPLVSSPPATTAAKPASSTLPAAVWPPQVRLRVSPVSSLSSIRESNTMDVLLYIAWIEALTFGALPKQTSMDTISGAHIMMSGGMSDTAILPARRLSHSSSNQYFKVQYFATPISNHNRINCRKIK